MADIEQKLAAARRLFSLHDYVPCEQLLLQVLELDPRNSKAKALYDLTAVKLSRRKLYKKMVEPKSADSLSGVNKPASEIGPTSPYSETPTEKENPKRTGSSSAEDFLTRQTPSSADSNSRPAEPADEAGSMRERTIMALVELFKEKERSVQNWQNPAFRPKQAERESGEKSGRTSFDRSSEGLSSPPISVRAPKQDEKIYKSNNQSITPAGQTGPKETTAARSDRETSQRAPESRLKMPEPGEPVRSRIPPVPEAQSESTEAKPQVIREPDHKPFDRIPPREKVDFKELVERKMEKCSEDLWNSEAQTISIAEIKKYLYQEEYELCAVELEKIRKRFPHNSAIQAFVDNTSKRLVELQRTKSFQAQARELMFSANLYYQEGKLAEALIAASEVLRIIPENQEVREFVSFVEKRLEKEKKKGKSGTTSYCCSCGIAVDPISRFCFHCGHRLT